MNQIFIIVYEDLRYGSRRTNILTLSIHERLQNKNIVIFLCLVNRGLWMSSRSTRSLFTIENI